MPDAHEAAVEAMAGAACLFRRDVAPGQCMAYDDVGEPAVHPECALAALVRCDAVREALVGVLDADDAPAWWWGEGPLQDAGADAGMVTDAILAALAAGEAT